MVDTNSDPMLVDYAIPANDDATKSIELIVDEMIKAINEGLEERKNAPEPAAEEAEDGEASEVTVAEATGSADGATEANN
jgi:small subunit ribosomal protein S2